MDAVRRSCDENCWPTKAVEDVTNVYGGMAENRFSRALTTNQQKRQSRWELSFTGAVSDGVAPSAFAAVLRSTVSSRDSPNLPVRINIPHAVGRVIARVPQAGPASEDTFELLFDRAE